MSTIFQVSLNHHALAMEAVYDRYPERRAARVAWGESEHVFVMPRSQEVNVAEIEAWLDETGVSCWIETTGPFTFFEFQSMLDAVAFKLRWF
ncbi:MAG: hypothetical protein EOP83_14525 [Verrucomicrobiaceae bacterium]|nr:MAG: hypothetical protein EOP83_14525 [Verrucomicrobiaceae bacterium]